MEKDPRSQIKCIHLEVRHYDVLMYDDELYDHKLYAGCQNISLSNCFQNVLRNKCLGIIFRPNVTFMYYFFFRLLVYFAHDISNSMEQRCMKKQNKIHLLK